MMTQEDTDGSIYDMKYVESPAPVHISKITKEAEQSFMGPQHVRFVVGYEGTRAIQVDEMIFL